jgi:hypothetical protein
MSELIKELMKSKAAPKKDPEFYEAQQELAYRHQWATMMKDAGRLTKAEFSEFEAHLAAAYLEAIPVERFVEMQEDGSYADLEAIAGHDGKRDRYDVLKDRGALNKKITQDVLDTALAENKIDAKRWNEEQGKLGTFDDDMTRRVTDAEDDGDHDSVAMDSLLGRLAPEEPEASAPVDEPQKIDPED